MHRGDWPCFYCDIVWNTFLHIGLSQVGSNSIYDGDASVFLLWLAVNVDDVVCSSSGSL